MPVTMPITTRITPCLWFDDNLEAAVRFWTSVLPNSEILGLDRTGDGSVVAGSWVLDGLPFRGINGGPTHAGFRETFSLSVSCADQAEVDHYWEALVADGEPSRCAWLKDRFGMSWQIVPTRLPELLGDAVPERARAAMTAMLSMSKIIIADLEAAADAAAPPAATTHQEN